MKKIVVNSPPPEIVFNDQIPEPPKSKPPVYDPNGPEFEQIPDLPGELTVHEEKKKNLYHKEVIIVIFPWNFERQ
eukprot:UN01061